MSIRRYYNNVTGESGYIHVEDEPAKPAKISASDIADGIKLYKKRKENDAYAAKGGQFIAPYNYGNYILHVIIACITGFIVASFTHPILGVICGIVSFIISFIIHWMRERRYCYDYKNYRESFIEKLKKYTIITVIAVIMIIVIINFIS